MRKTASSAATRLPLQSAGSEPASAALPSARLSEPAQRRRPGLFFFSRFCRSRAPGVAASAVCSERRAAKWSRFHARQSKLNYGAEIRFARNAPNTQHSGGGQNAVWQRADQQLASQRSLATSPGEIIHKNLIFPPSVLDKERPAATGAALADSHSGTVLRTLHFLHNALNFFLPPLNIYTPSDCRM